MKCLLVLPAWKVSDFFPEEFSASATHRWHPLGLLYIAAQLLQDGHETKLLDGAFWSHEEILEEFRRFGPQFVGIYANCPLWNKAMETARDLKAIDPTAFVSVGGPAPIGWRDRCLRECDEVDCIHTGEGELSVSQVVRLLDCGRRESLNQVRGIIFRDRGGGIVANPDSLPVLELDSLPFPARHLLGDLVNQYLPNIGTFRRAPVHSMLSSRGCSYGACNFCFRPDKLKIARFRSARNVVDEMEECVRRYGAKEIKFLDDTFTADPQRVSEICAEIRRRRLKVDWFVSSRVNAVTLEMLQEMKRAGCWAILYGIESGVQKNVDALRKGTTLDQARYAVRAARKAGLQVSTPFIFGIPGETFEEGLQSIEFAIELNADMANFHTLTPFPGTKLYDHIEHYGTMTTATDELTFEGAAFVPFSMSREQILELKQLAFKRFYRRPSYALRRLLGVRTRYDALGIWHGLRALLTLYRGPNVFSRSLQRKSGLHVP